MNRFLRTLAKRSDFRFVLCASALVSLTVLHSIANGDDSILSPHYVNSPKDVADLKRLESQTKQVLGDVLPAIVAVSNVGHKTKSSESVQEGSHFASGVIIRADGLVLSQYHVSHSGTYDDDLGLVVDGQPGERVDVVLHDGRQVEAELLGAHRLTDLSLLRIIEPGTYPFVELADSNSTKLGDWVLKPGHPTGYRKQRGTVSRLGRIVYQNQLDIVADCMIAGGDSGGPIINLDGKLIGLVKDSVIPRTVALAGETVRSDYLSSFTTVRKIQNKMATMLAKQVPRDTDYRELDERRKQYQTELAILPPHAWTNGNEVTKAWHALTAKTRGSIVDVLDEQQRRVVLGTVVDSEGWILTKASEIGKNPRCRLPNGEIVQSKVIGVEASFDVAMLKVSASELKPVQWSKQERPQTGTHLVAPQIDGRPIAAGIVSVPTYQPKGPFPNTVMPAPKRPKFEAMFPALLGQPGESQGLVVTFVVGTAARAGILQGDTILEINGESIQSRNDISTVARGKSPGETLRIVSLRDGKRVEQTLTLEPQVYQGTNSFRSHKFPKVFEHDASLTPEECGGPVFGLDGKALGITIARSSSYGCMAIPANALRPIIEALKTAEARINVHSSN